MRISANEPEADGLNLTPIIDVVFLLLSFFLVATQLAKDELELKINLPEVTQAEPMSMTKELVVNVTREGKYKVLQHEYSERELLALLQRAREKNPQKRVMIRADEDAAWKYGVRVMGLCNEAKIDKYYVAGLHDRSRGF